MLMLLPRGSRGLGAATAFANKARSRIPEQNWRVATAVSRDSQAGD